MPFGGYAGKPQPTIRVSRIEYVPLKILPTGFLLSP